MSMLKDLIKTINSPVRLSSRAKTKGRRMLGMAVSTLFLQDQSALCKVEFIQPSNWLYFVPNFLVIQHLETLYLGGIHVKVVCERV